MADDNLEQLPRTRKEALALGATWYFSGHLCKRGHAAKRFVANRTCVDCACVHAKTRYNTNTDRLRKKSREYHLENRDKIISKMRAYYHDNIDDAKIRHRKWLAENQDKVRNYRVANRDALQAARRARYAANPEQERLANLRWSAANPEAQRIFKHTRRARERNAGGVWTAEDIDRIGRAQKGKCASCGKRIKKHFHVDHIQPLAKGGTNWPNNLQLLCPPCNLSKNARDPIEYAQSNGLLL
jgi:5-methylcytosine-specific restriction endonuclease McrA